jgi:uncharacterized RDD family membrane protein YckC
MEDMAAPLAPLDTTVEIVTPENIAFRYRLAGPFRRLPALLLDVMIQLAAGAAAAIGATLILHWLGLPGLGLAVTLVCWFVLFWLYGGLFETFWNGQTPGKRLLGIRVLTLDGQPVNALQAILRNVLRIVDAQPLCFFQVGLWSAAMTRRFQRLGDLACGTMVVVEERARLPGVVRMGAAEAARLAALIPANFPVSRSLGLALAAYVERRTAFSPGRRLEIARRVAEPLRLRFQLPADTDLDMLLCGLYQRAFITDRDEGAAAGGAAFRPAPSPLAELPPMPSLQVLDAS